MATVTGTQLQKALKQVGHDPGPIDGIIGDRTQAALGAWLQTQPLPDFDTAVSADRRTITVDPPSLAKAIARHAQAYINAQPPAGTQTRTRAPVESSGPGTSSTAPTMFAQTEMFWRRDNPFAWLAGAVGVAVVVGGGYYAYKRFR